ncbi:hypothetical protein J6590_092546 [Homalodisca vitripennis]|nr:hypothetical protein J6590_092546 [Homalodisca vitripennis]
MKFLLLSIVFVCAILPSIESSEYHGSNAIGHVNNKVYRSNGGMYNRGNLRDELRELQTTLYKIGERIKEFVKNNFNGVYNTMIAVMKAVEKTSSLDSTDRKACSDEGYFKEASIRYVRLLGGKKLKCIYFQQTDKNRVQST